MADVLFVCTGNVCRSPMAEYIARRLIAGSGLTVASAGTHALEGSAASRHTAALMRGRGYDLSAHVARQLSVATLTGVRLAFGMEPFHVSAIRSLDKTVAAALLDPDHETVEDPGLDGAPGDYVRAADHIAAALGRRLDQLT